MPDSAIRKRLLESRMEARDSQLQLAALLSGCGTWTLEPATGEFHCSARALSLLGLPADAQLHLPELLHLVHPEDRQHLGNALAHALTVRDQFDLEFALAGDIARGRQLRCLGRPHSSALNPDRHALSGILVPVAVDANGLVSLDPRRLTALVLRLEGLRGLERGTLVTQLQSGLLARVSDLRQHVATLAADPTLTPPQRGQLQPVLDTAAGCLKMLREMIFDLDPPGVRQLGFSGALERYARETSAAAGLELSLQMPRKPVLLPGIAEEALYRAACAGIDNVAAHAHASRMWVSMEPGGNEVVLKISDDGRGIHGKDVAAGSGLGLYASSARLGACGGSLRIRNRAEGGTVLELSVATDQTGWSQRRQAANQTA